jgi:PAS domain S-box-containing protein
MIFCTYKPWLLPRLLTFAATLIALLLFYTTAAFAKPIRFVGNQDYPPIEFSEEGKAKGLYVDIINALSLASGREMTVTLLEWEKAQQMVRHADADAAGLLAITEERKTIYDFTDTVMDLEYSLFVRADQTLISSSEDLQGKSVGVIAGGFPLQLLKESGLGIHLVIVTDHEDGLRQLEKGTIQAFAGDKWVISYHLQQEQIGNIRAIAPPFATKSAAFAVKKGNLPLVQELNRALAQIKRQGILKKLQDKWSSQQMVIMTREGLTRSIALACSATLLVLSLGLFFWIYTLKRQIAERKQAEYSLKESESRFRNVFDNAPVAIGIGETDSGKMVEVNDAWLKLLGYDLHEVIGKTTTELGLYVDSLEREDIIRTIGERGKVQNRSTQLRCKSGEILDILYFAEVFSVNSKPYMQVMMADITEHRRAEYLLNKGRVEIYNLFNNSAVAMFRSRLDGSEVMNANEKFFEIVGGTREDVVGKPVMVHYAEPEQRAEMLRRLNADGSVVDFEVKLLNKNGGTRHCLASLTLSTDAGILDGSIIDISARKRAEESLSRSEALYREFVEGTSDLVTQVDSQGRFLYVNQNARKYFGCPAAECVGLSAFDFVHPEDRARTATAFRNWVGDCARCVTFENRQVGRTGEVHDMLWTINLTYDDSSLKQVNSIARDITEQRKLQNEQIKNQKLESLGVLAGGIAHDFNNILTGIVGSISLARMLLEHSHQASGLLAQAEDACQRAADLAQQLLTFARGSQPIKKLVSARRIVEASASLVLRGSRAQSVITVADDLKALEADEGQLSQAFNNIIINAAQAMPEGGVITISAENAVLGEINDQSLPSGTYVKISCADTGCGIPVENQKDIFDPYFTTKASGNGLGLASVHSIISKHAGHIGVSSREGAGTTFVVLLPASEQQAEETKVELSALPGRKQTHGPILVMDDEEVIRKLAAEMLLTLGYEVQTCSSGEQAITIYRAAMTAEVPFAAVIMDLTVPGGMGGKEAARRILELDPTAYLIVSSGYSNDPVMAGYAKFGFSATLAKPYNIIGLEKMLNTMFQAASAA